MSYATKIENQFRNDAYKEAGARVRSLEDRLHKLERDAKSSSIPNPREVLEAHSDLPFLERLCAADARSVLAQKLHRDLKDKLPDYRRRLQAFPMGKEELPTRNEFPLKRASSSASRSSLQSGQGTITQTNSKTGLAAVSSFIGADEDEVRILAAEGKLGLRLGESPMLKVGARADAMLFREYTEADREEERAQYVTQILELKNDIVRLHEIVRTVDDSVGAAADPLNELETRVASANEEWHLAVGALRNANKLHMSFRALIFLVLAIIVIFFSWKLWQIDYLIAFSAALCVATCLLLLSCTSWRMKMVVQMQHQLPRCNKALPEEEVSRLREKGEEAERRLLQALDAEDVWQHLRHVPVWTRMSMTKLTLARKDSACRLGGSAYKISFVVPGTARHLYQVFRKLSVAGSVDTFSKCTWSRPIDSSTSFRYLILSNTFVERDFFMVSRAGRASTPGDSERYVFAQSSLTEEELRESTLANTDSRHGEWHGTALYIGMRISECTNPPGSSRVEMAADVDPNAPCLLHTCATDLDLRSHMIASARSLLKELHAADVLVVRHTSRERLEAVKLKDGERLWSDNLYTCQGVPQELAGGWLYRHRFRGLPRGSGEVYAPDGAKVYIFQGRFRQNEDDMEDARSGPSGPETLGWSRGPAGMVAQARGQSVVDLTLWQRTVEPGDSLPWPTDARWKGSGIIVVHGC